MKSAPMRKVIKAAIFEVGLKNGMMGVAVGQVLVSFGDGGVLLTINAARERVVKYWGEVATLTYRRGFSDQEFDIGNLSKGYSQIFFNLVFLE